MKSKNIIILLFLLVFLLGCSDNIFGSSGSSGSDCDDDVSCLRIAAEEAFRKGEYKNSYDLYERIVKADSNASVGYFGMAKAGLWMHGLTLFSLVGLNKDSDSEDPMDALFQKDAKFKNNYLQGAKKAYNALRILSERDSLTELNKNSPKTDGEFGKNAFGSGLYLTETIFKSMSLLFDFWGNECIYDKAPKSKGEAEELGCLKFPLRGWGGSSTILEYKCSTDEDGIESCGLEPNLENVYKDITDPTTGEDARKDINDKLDNIDSEIDDLIAAMNPNQGDKDEMLAKLDSMKGYTSFLKLHMGVDTDGDGCIDEELIFNSKTYDTDGDGINGENSRIIEIDPTAFEGCGFDGLNDPKCHYTTKRYGVDHNMNGNKDDYFIMFRNEERLDTNIRVAWSLDPYWSNPDKDLKKEVQTEKDKDGNKRCWGLQERKERIGGCWVNYDDDKFKAYRNNKKQQEDGGMNIDCIGVY